MPLLIHSCKSTQKTQKRGGQKANYSVKGGFSDENPPFCRLTLDILDFAKEQCVLIGCYNQSLLFTLKILQALFPAI